MKTETYEAIVAIIHDKDEYLLLKKKGTYTGWQFAQGKVEIGEKIEDTVKREIEEETGLTNIEIKEKLPFKKDYWFTFENQRIHKYLTYFVVKTKKTDNIKISKEHSDFEWVKGPDVSKKIKFNKKIFEEYYDKRLL